MLKRLLPCLALLSVVAIPFTGSASSVSDSEKVNVKFEQPDTLQLTVSANELDFGTVSGLTESTATDSFTAKVSSSLNYDLSIIAESDFKNSEDNSITIPITKLAVKGDENDFKNFSSVGDKMVLVSNQSSTYLMDGEFKSHDIGFKLDKTVGNKNGEYIANTSLVAEQK